jgi:hypothetical protein
MVLTVVDLQVGDVVSADGDDPEYEVSSIDAQQGCVQVADTVGAVHT